MTAIPITKTIKGPIDPSAKPVIDVLGSQQVRGHHRRECERNHSGNEDGASEGQSELAKERAGQAALKRDGRVTVASVRVIAMMGPTSSRAPLIAAFMR